MEIQGRFFFRHLYFRDFYFCIFFSAFSIRRFFFEIFFSTLLYSTFFIRYFFFEIFPFRDLFFQHFAMIPCSIGLPDVSVTCQKKSNLSNKVQFMYSSQWYNKCPSLSILHWRQSKERTSAMGKKSFLFIQKKRRKIELKSEKNIKFRKKHDWEWNIVQYCEMRQWVVTLRNALISCEITVEKCKMRWGVEI